MKKGAKKVGEADNALSSAKNVIGDIELGSNGPNSKKMVSSTSPLDLKQPSALRECLKWLQIYFCLMIIAGVIISFVITDGYDLSSAGECTNGINGFNVSTVSTVSKTLSDHCECIPQWMKGDVYFDPLSTLFLAFLAVMFLTNTNRISPIINDITGRVFAVCSTENILLRFKCLPKHMQANILTSLELVYPNMPTIENITPKKSSLNSQEKTNEAADAMTMWLKMEFDDMILKFKNNEKWHELNDQNILQEVAEDLNTGLDVMLKTIKSKLDVNNVPIRLDNDTQSAIELDNVDDDGINSINPEFYEWLDEHKEVFLQQVLSSQEEQCEEAEKPDTTVMLMLELIVGIWVLIDYFGVQTWPSGNSWLCRWAYLSAVVMYKPFTVPMWFCLTLVCHYTFTDRIYKGFQRDEATGTPFGAPFMRSKLSMVLIAGVALMQLFWFFGVMILALPLMVIFLPVLAVLGFVFPFLITQLPQKATGMLKMYLEKKLMNKKQFNEVLDLVKPLHITETVYILKASATQLISLSMLTYLLLPFFTGKLTWQEAAQKFLSFSFDFPRLKLLFNVTFEIPQFEQPRLAVQLAIGIFLASLQLIFKAFKRLLIKNLSLILMKKFENEKNQIDSKTNFWLKLEEFLMELFDRISWGFFRKLMATGQAAFEASNTKYFVIYINLKKMYFERFVVLPWYGMKEKEGFLFWISCVAYFLLTPLIWFSFYAFYFIRFATSNNRTKYFGNETGDDDILEFSLSEDSMNYEKVVLLEGCLATQHSLPFLMPRCPWLELNLDALDTHGHSVLMRVVSKQSLTSTETDEAVGLVKYLIKAGANVNTRGKNDLTALMCAVEADNVVLIKTLVEAGAHLEATTKNGKTALMLAAEKGKSHSTVTVLLDLGASKNTITLASEAALVSEDPKEVLRTSVDTTK